MIHLQVKISPIWRPGGLRKPNKPLRANSENLCPPPFNNLPKVLSIQVDTNVELELEKWLSKMRKSGEKIISPKRGKANLRIIPILQAHLQNITKTSVFKKITNKQNKKKIKKKKKKKKKKNSIKWCRNTHHSPWTIESRVSYPLAFPRQTCSRITLLRPPLVLS